MGAFGYDASYEHTCLNYTLREQVSWDFVVCEGEKGWAAAHITLPLITYVFIQHFWATWCMPGLFEVFETMMLLMFQHYVVFAGVGPGETVAGSLIGDWLINGTVGVLLGMLLVRALRLPRLLPRVVDHPHVDPVLVRAMRWRYFCFWVLFAITNLPVGWVIPVDCKRHVPFNCTNSGLMLSTAVQAWLLYCLHRLHRDDALVWAARAGPRGYAAQRWALATVWLVIFTINLQNFQPLVPHYLGVGSGFTQPWLASALWLLLLGAAALHDGGGDARHWCRVHWRVVARAAGAPRFFCCCSACACCRCANQDALPDEF
jgi:hypothetical protein